MAGNIENERLKRRYREYLKSVKGYAPSTINSINRSIWLYECLIDHEDFLKLRIELPVRFKERLSQPGSDGKTIPAHRQSLILKSLREFFVWLSMFSAFKSRITMAKIEYFNSDRRQRLQASNVGEPKDFPSLEYVKQLVGSIEIRTEIDRRDRALPAFLLLSAMRDLAVATLPLGFFDPNTGRIDQDSERGVKTKFGKKMITYLFNFDSELRKEVDDWYQYLTITKGYLPSAPLFPMSHTVRNRDSELFEAFEVEPEFWTTASPIRDILIQRSSAAGLPYFNPHSFRHAAKYIAYKHCRVGEEIQAVTNNLGHNKPDTTMFSYGKLNSKRLGEVISNIGIANSIEIGNLSIEALEIAKLLDANNVLARLRKK